MLLESTPPDLSIVSTMYESASYLAEFVQRIGAEAKKMLASYEVVFVNDGSPDNSLETAIALQQSDPHIRIVDLSRNFGHHKAMMTGLMHARGKLTFLIDCDLEEPPELLSIFNQQFEASNADVIYGVQETRKGGWFEQQSGEWFYRLFNMLSETTIPANVLVARLMSRRYVDALVQHQEDELLIGGLWQITGFKQVPVEVKKHSKQNSTYNLSRKIGLVVRGVTAFSSRPLLYIAYLGAFILVASLIYSLALIAIRLFLGHPPSGYTSLIVSIWFLGGLIIFCQGVIAIYLSVIFKEVKHRPYTIIRHIHEPDGLSHEASKAVEAGRTVLHGKG
jgi:putative glycosyltransferase